MLLPAVNSPPATSAAARCHAQHRCLWHPACGWHACRPANRSTKLPHSLLCSQHLTPPGLPCWLPRLSPPTLPGPPWAQCRPAAPVAECCTDSQAHQCRLVVGATPHLPWAALLAIWSIPACTAGSPCSHRCRTLLCTVPLSVVLCLLLALAGPGLFRISHSGGSSAGSRPVYLHAATAGAQRMTCRATIRVSAAHEELRGAGC